MTFSEPIVAGETILQDLQSEGFSSGVSGWRIERDGNVEFNDADIRGTLDVVGSDPDARIRVIVNGGTPVLQITDSAGNIYEFKASTTASMSIRPTTAGNSGLHFVRGEGIALRADATGAPSVLFDDDDGFLKRGSFSPWAETGWQTATLMSGTGTVQYKLLPDGNVMMRGSQAPAANVAGTDLLTLPVGYRPALVCRFEMSTGDTSAGGRVQINTAGLVEIARAAGIASYWYDGILFSTI